MLEDIMQKSSLAPESAGIAKISLYGDGYVIIENHSFLADMKPECIKVQIKKRILAINGERLSIAEMDGCTVRIKGKILSIEYLT